ncbi:hypothetical protein B0H11DRAFT_1965364 [Mycena galericulata]|nr:hypothetical protein B0H11DRAFT_1965364 [Mycena galericulata]
MPTFPFELEREIFEIALRLDRKNAVLKLNLSLVARRVHSWVDLVFYETVKIESAINADKFLILIARKPPGFFAVAVKNLSLLYKVPASEMLAILSECSGVQQLACWGTHRHTAVLPFLCRLALNRLSIEFSHFLNIPATPPTCFSSLVRLHLFFWDDDKTPDISRLIQGLRQLPRLTHTAFSFSPFTANIVYARAVCSNLPNLRVVVIDEDDDVVFEGQYSSDARIVVMHRINVLGDWEAANEGNRCMWDRAEEVVARRQAQASARV